MSRRPQVPARAMRAAVRGLVRPVPGPRTPTAVQRRWLDLVTGMTPLADGVDVRTGRLGARPVRVFTPRDAEPGRVVLCLHGGGFTIGSVRTHAALAAELAAATSATRHLLDYRLAPEHPFPAALDDALAAYRELLRGRHGPRSDGAGGRPAARRARSGLALAGR